MFLKLTLNGQSDKAFLLSSKFCPLCWGYTHVEKTLKNVYKIRVQRKVFETYTKCVKWQGLSVDIKILSSRGCLLLPWGYKHVEKHKKYV